MLKKNKTPKGLWAEIVVTVVLLLSLTILSTIVIAKKASGPYPKHAGQSHVTKKN
jgi:hypothetical protein